jgi:hypothetical protein
LARVNKETVNRLSPETAVHVFRESLPSGNKPVNRKVLVRRELGSNGGLFEFTDEEQIRTWVNEEVEFWE